MLSEQNNIKRVDWIQSYHSWLLLILRLLDVSVVMGTLLIVCRLRSVGWSDRYTAILIQAVLLTVIAMHAVNLYRPWRGDSILHEFRLIFAGWMLVVVGLLSLTFITKSTAFLSRIVVTAWFLSAPMAMAMVHWLGRLVLHELRRRGYNTRSAVIAGAGHLGEQLAQCIQNATWAGIDLIGFFDDDKSKQSKQIGHLTIKGRLDQLPEFVVRRKVEMVYLTLPMCAQERIQQLMDVLQDTNVAIFLVPDIFVFDLLRARLQDMGGLPVFSLCESPFLGPFGFFKRLEDILVASLILILISPLMVIIAMLIKLTSRGPVIFKQRRYGLNGREVVVWKFRSMTVCEDGDRIPQAKSCDPRVTWLGAFLRSTSLDELPQFINVLQGHMSVVGPRPHAVAHNEFFRKLVKGYMWRHKVKPGITGWAQINGWRGETDTLEKMQKRVQYDMDYIRNWSLWLDIKIIFISIFKGFVNKGAY